MPDFNETLLETQLRRFLYIGKEKPEYQPGNWFVHDYYLAQNVPSIDELAADPVKHDTIISSIVEAQDKQLVQNPETLVFALALCAQQEVHESLRRKAYNSVKRVCESPERFMLFNKFCSQIIKRHKHKKSGWGHGWKRTVKEWYLGKEPLELAKIVTQIKSRYGWKHKDILKLAHISVKDESDAMKAIFAYTLYGMKKLKEMKPESEQQQQSPSQSAEELVRYLEKVEEFKHCEDEIKAAAMIDAEGYTLDHVPGHLLKSEEVWDVLVSRMNLTELLKHLQRIHNMGFLKPNDRMVAKALDLITDERVREEKLHPAVFLVAIKNYESGGKELTFEKRKVRAQAVRPVVPASPPPDVNKKILDALRKSFNTAFENLQPTNVHYMITIFNLDKLMSDWCWQCGNLSADEAACLVALSLLRAEKHVTLAVFTDEGVRAVDVDRNCNLAQLRNKLQARLPESVELGSPMLWAAERKKSVDVFVNITDQICQKSDSSEEGIRVYRRRMGLPNAKLVNCALCASTTYTKEAYDQNILSVCGFDEKVPKIIEAFARSYF